MIDLVLPIGVLLAGSLVVYIVARASHNKALTGFVTILALALCGYVIELLQTGDPMMDMPAGAEPLFATFNMTPLGVFMAWGSLGLSAIVALFSIGYMSEHNIGKYYALLLMMTAGMVGIGIANDLFNLFVMFELMSLASFALVAFEDEWEPVEAGMKYVLLSAMGSMIALLGIVLVFAYTGTLNFELLNTAAIAGKMRPDLLLGCAALMIGGFGVKAAIVPMHTWLPDAHSAAPSGISAMLSGMVISAGLITLIKALTVLHGLELGLILVLMAVVTMFAGNMMAIWQTDLKRMLAYSSIANIGYILVGVGVAFAAPEIAAFDGFRGGLYHILNHAIIKGGAFLCAGAIITAVGSRDFKEIAGIGRKLPVVGVAFAVFALSLAGAPPLNGFISKLFICLGAMKIPVWGFTITVIVVLNSLLSLFYYVPAMNKILLAREDEMSEKVKATSGLPASITLAIFILALLTLGLGIAPQYGLDIVDPAAHYLATLLTQ